MTVIGSPESVVDSVSRSCLNCNNCDVIESDDGVFVCVLDQSYDKIVQPDDSCGLFERCDQSQFIFFLGGC